MKESYYLSAEVLNWYMFVESSGEANSQDCKRAYVIWSHAENLLNRSVGALDRVDVVTTLKRAMDQRLKLLTKEYMFSNIRLKTKSNKTLELFQYLGIIRPLMLRKLLDIRNKVEHQDVAPPSKDICENFLDLVWYFLKSTDSLLKRIPNDFLFQDVSTQKEAYWISLSISYSDWIPDIRGWCRPLDLTKVFHSDCINVIVDRLETKDSFIDREKVKNIPKFLAQDTGRGLKLEDVYFSGKVIGPECILEKIYKKIFETY